MIILDLKRVLIGLAAISISYAMFPISVHGQAKTKGIAQKELRLIGKAVFSDANDGDQYKNKDWTSQGIVINCTLSKNGKEVTDLTIDVNFGMNLNGFSVSNSKQISCPGTFPVTNKNLSIHIDNEDCICNLHLYVLDNSANGTVDFTYKYELGTNKLKTYFGNDPIFLKEKTE